MHPVKLRESFRAGDGHLVEYAIQLTNEEIGARTRTEKEGKQFKTEIWSMARKHGAYTETFCTRDLLIDINGVQQSLPSQGLIYELCSLIGETDRLSLFVEDLGDRLNGPWEIIR